MYDLHQMFYTSTYVLRYNLVLTRQGRSGIGRCFVVVIVIVFFHSTTPKLPLHMVSSSYSLYPTPTMWPIRNYLYM